MNVSKKMGLGDLNHDKVHKIFYDELKKRGYGAVIDVNDSRKEGFTFNPVIVFDNQIKHVIGTTKASDSQLHGEQALKGIKYAMQRKASLNPLTDPAIAATGYAYLYAVGIATNKNTELDQRTEFVNQYLKDHPNTRKSRSQIAEMYG